MQVLFGKNWVMLFFGAISLSALLLLPQPYRDVMVTAAVVGAVVLSFKRLASVWLGVLALLPLIRLSGELFGWNGVTASRLLVISLASIAFVIPLMKFGITKLAQDARGQESPLRAEMQNFIALAQTNGGKFFGLFVVVNVLSALHVASVPAFFVAMTYLEPLLFFALSFVLVWQRRIAAADILRAILWGALLVAGVALYEWMTQQAVSAWLNPNLKNMLEVYLYGFDSNRFGLGGRLGSLIAQPVVASLYWVLVLILALYYFRAHARAKWIQAAWGLVCLALLLVTGTRAGLLALAAAFVVYWVLGLRTLRRRIFALNAAAVGALTLALALPTLTDYLVATFTLDTTSNAPRNVHWRVAITGGLLQIFQANWLLGYGPGLVQKQAAAGEIPKIDGEYSLGGLENQYATILADGGIVAGGAYFLFMLGTIQDAWQMFCAARWRARGVVLFALFAAYFVFAVTEMMLIEIPNLLLMAVYGAFMADVQENMLERNASLF